MDFNTIRQKFLEEQRGRIHAGLTSVFGAHVSLQPTPLAANVMTQFMQAFSLTNADIRPAFHGTNAKNYTSIFQRGLLIPGHGNELQIIHGAVHGTGIYTANVDAAWLSKGFCTEDSMLVCAVLHTADVRHHGDAMIVGRAELVAPFFLATRECKAVAPPQVALRSAGALPAHAAGPNGKVTKAVKDESKTSKFKARLAAKSQRH